MVKEKKKCVKYEREYGINLISTRQTGGKRQVKHAQDSGKIRKK